MKEWHAILLALSSLAIALAMVTLAIEGRQFLDQVEMGKTMPFIMVDPGVSTTMDPRK